MNGRANEAQDILIFPKRYNKTKNVRATNIFLHKVI